MHLRAGELAIGDERIYGPDHLELFRPAGTTETIDIAPRVQIDFAPHADGIERHLNLMQPFGGAALAPEIIVGRMLLNQKINVAELLARLLAVGGMPVDDAVLVPPITAEEVSEYSALIHRSAIGIVHAVEGRDARKRRRLLNRHPPLQHAEIGLADAADFAVRPGLMSEPFDDVVKVLLLVAVEQPKLTA